MKTRTIFLAFLALSLSFSACNKVPKSGKVKFKSQNDSVSYALGYIEANNYIKSFEQIPFEIDSMGKVHLAKALAKTKLQERYLKHRSEQFDNINVDIFYKGFLNQLAYGKSYFDERGADMYLRNIFNKKKAEKDSIKIELSKAQLLKGQKFLDENKMREGVKVTESGLQYEIIKEGKGNLPKAVDRVKCVYHGTLIDGTVFDSSKEAGDTTTFAVNRVIKGWGEALQLMPQGSEWRLYIPASLAYGERGAGDKVGPNEALIFEVNLVEVMNAEKK